MVSFALGIAFGIFMTIWYLVFDFSFNFDHAITVNVMIAVATMIAAAIHFDSVRHQRKDRLWEINKESLLKLSKAISDSVEMTSKFQDDEFYRMHGIEDKVKDINTDGYQEVFKQFEETISDSINVYKPLLSSIVIEAIEEYQQSEKNIIILYDSEEYTEFQVYEDRLFIQKKLQKVVLNYIKQASRI
ncbi:hypothetical protein C0W54_18155 [Photobacterium kishitanii]|uniref:hypothetical protein n=1 Tax=Photobacterium kishitanii TaxID=318456 RepID=UPI000D16D1A7|nr:hypothetical protein [Photobacterium kishitanii]PSW59895.1 hypothetical protein C0W54_18155 [Photobacterium kishitanii]